MVGVKGFEGGGNLVGSESDGCGGFRCGVSNAVGEDALDLGVVVDGEGFVAGAEVDDGAFAAGPGAA